MSNFFLSRPVLIAVAIRIILFEFTDLATISLKLPFTNSLQTDYNRLEECFFLMDKGYNPYDFRLIFHKPLEVVFFKALSGYKYLTLAFVIMIDVLVAYLISSPSMTIERFEGELKRKDRIGWSIWALFNPFSILQCIRLSTNCLEIFLPLFTVYANRRWGYIVGGILFGYCIYHSIQLVPIVAVLLLQIYENTEDRRHISWSKTTYFFGSAVLSYSLAIFVSGLILGNYVFWIKGISETIAPNYVEANLNFGWFLQASLFNRYKELYYYVLYVILISFSIPIHAVFHKYHRYQRFRDGYLSYFTGIMLAIIYIFTTSGTFYDLSTILLLLYTQYELIFKIRLLVIFNYAKLFLLCVSVYMAHMWATSNTAEASFVFFYLTIAGALFVIFLSENLTTLQIQTYTLQRELEPTT